MAATVASMMWRGGAQADLAAREGHRVHEGGRQVGGEARPPAVSAITRSKLLIARWASTISVEKNTGRRLGMMMRQ